MTDQNGPPLHRGTTHVHEPAIVSELKRVPLPSGRTLIFERVTFARGKGSALHVGDEKPDGRRYGVAIPRGCLAELRAAIDAFFAAEGPARPAPKPGPAAAPPPSPKPDPNVTSELAPRPRAPQPTQFLAGPRRVPPPPPASRDGPGIEPLPEQHEEIV